MQVAGARKGNEDLVIRELWRLFHPGARLCLFQLRTFSGLKQLPGQCLETLKGMYTTHSHLEPGTRDGAGSTYTKTRKKEAGKEDTGAKKGFGQLHVYQATGKATYMPRSGCTLREDLKRILNFHHWLAFRLCARGKERLSQSCDSLTSSEEVFPKEPICKDQAFFVLFCFPQMFKKTSAKSLADH